MDSPHWVATRRQLHKDRHQNANPQVERPASRLSRRAGPGNHGELHIMADCRHLGDKTEPRLSDPSPAPGPVVPNGKFMFDCRPINARP